MYDVYQELYNKYSAEYGPKTAIFLQVGSFYELYDVQGPDGRTKMNVKDVVDILGIQLKVKRADAPGGQDGLFSGFPDYVLHKWAGKLTGAGWTVVVVDQVKDKSDKVTERKVSRILSPSTHLEALSTFDAPTIVSVWFAGPSASAAAFDLSTGSTYTTTCTIRGSQESWTSDELLHFLSVFRPRELLVFGSQDEATLRKQLDYTWPGTLLHIRPQSLGSLELPLPRDGFLRRLYQPRTVLPLPEYLHLKSVTEEKVLCGLLRFIEDHFPSSFERLKQNQPWNPTNLLLLGNHALNQLQITGPTLEETVLGLFKYSATTAFGKRALRQRLLMPSADPALIVERLDQVDAALSASADSVLGGSLGANSATQSERLSPGIQVQRNLRLIYDLPRLHRKMQCAEIGSAEILALQSSYAAATAICPMVASGPLQPGPVAEHLKTAASALAALFDLERAATEDANITFLPAAQHPELAAIETKLAAVVAELESFLKVMTDLAGGGTLRWEPKERAPYGLRGTRTALTTLKAAIGTPAAGRALAALAPEQKTFSVSIQKGGGWVESDWLDQMNGRVSALRDQLQREFRLALPDVCAAFCTETQPVWTAMEDWLAAVDVSFALAAEAKARRWCRPTIATNSNGSEFDACGLRHPLIESIVTRTEYVAHNVRLDQGQGWLVYGMNASGKSSLMKSIGIAVHLAQAGCYVPATSLRLAPYRSLFTRILNQDNLWAGLSSFAVEMSEMRDILRAADPYTLVLGDELCSGTESVSAKALVAAGIEWLHERRATYVFATHLHGLTEVLPAPQEINLAIWHLKVHYDPVTQKLIYERNLTPGPGSSLYGLEVARAMNVPVAYLEKALAIRRRLLGTAAEEEAPRSTWNSAVTRRACEVCGHAVTRDLEVHHVHERAAGGTNDARNLMVLCAACHDQHHAAPEASQASRSLTVTSDGLERIVVQAEEAKSVASNPKAKQKGKWTDEERTTILNVLSTYPNLPAKQVVFRLKHSEGIEISEATLRKFKNGTL